MITPDKLKIRELLIKTALVLLISILQIYFNTFQISFQNHDYFDGIKQWTSNILWCRD